MGQRVGIFLNEKQTSITFKSRPPQHALSVAAAVQPRELELEWYWLSYPSPKSEDSIQGKDPIIKKTNGGCHQH